MKKVQLLYVYIDNFFGFHRQEFNFGTTEQYHVYEQDGIIHLTEKYARQYLPEGFWGENIAGISLLIGDNGAGKTSLIRIICSWICRLSEGIYPKEKGIILFCVNNEKYYIGFEQGKRLYVKSNIKKITKCNEKLLKSITSTLHIVYYSNTLTEMTIDGTNKCMKDFSLANRMRKAEVDKCGFSDDIVSNYNRNEFDAQIKSALEDDDFPLEYINLEITGNPFNELIGIVPAKYISTMESLREYWYKQFITILYKDKQQDCELQIQFAQSFYVGIFVKLLEMDDGNQLHNSISEKINIISKTMQDNGGIDYNCSDVRGCLNWMESFLKAVVYRVCQYSQREAEGRYLTQLIESFCCYMMKEVSDETSSRIFEEFKPINNYERKLSRFGRTRIRLCQSNRNGFGELWKIYKQSMSFMKNIRMSWEGSSGEKSWAGLYAVLHESIHKNQNVWFFLDEPDNTFHPEWKRLLIDRIVEVCNKSDIDSKSIQLWITTHSPILLSDVPGTAVTYLKCNRNNDVENRKETVPGFQETFGQNIYMLFNDAFFLKDGVIGEFSSHIITETVIHLHDLEQSLLDGEVADPEKKLSIYENYVSIVGEPLFRRQMEEYIYRCRKLIQLRNVR